MFPIRPGVGKKLLGLALLNAAAFALVAGIAAVAFTRVEILASDIAGLEHLRQAMPDADSPNDALLVKLLDVEQGEISRVVRLSATQRQAADARAEEIAAGLATLDDSSRFAVVAALLKRFTDNQSKGEQNHD